MKYLKKHKKLLLISIVLVIVTSIFLVLNNSHAYHELPKVKLKGDINKSGLAIMVERDYKSGEYQKLDSTTFPTDGYTLNRIKSGCVDKNGKNIDALTYNENDKTISIKTKQSVYCYLYYDNLFKGEGTEDEPYQINYIEDLVRLSNSVNKDLNTYTDKNFKLMRDLDFNENESYMKYNDTGFGDINGVNNIEGIKDELTNKEGTGFIPIGNNKIYFQGNFNGNNKRLDNLYIVNKLNESIGFFGEIENSLINNLTISGNTTTLINSYIGGLIGKAHGNTTVDNCTNEVNLKLNETGYGAGGIIAISTDSLNIKKCVNKGEIVAKGDSGGIIGVTGKNMLMEESHNEGNMIDDIGGTSVVGGLIGTDGSLESNSIIKNSYNQGQVINTINSIGGTKGGLIGTIKGGADLENCYNLGDVIYQKEVYTDLSYPNVLIGGIIGNITNVSVKPVTLNNCYNSGTMENGRVSGGLIGAITGINGIGKDRNTIINNCYNSGDVVANLDFSALKIYSGGVGAGFVGQISGSNVDILNSYNTGTIDFSNYKSISGVTAHGIIFGSWTSNTTILNTYNVGLIKSPNNSTGIYFDNNKEDSSIINNVYNLGDTIGAKIYGVSYYNQVNEVYELKNAYYLNKDNIEGSNMGETTPMTEAEMKNISFVNILNKNVDELNNAGLETIDENLKGYELEKWGIKYNGYPVLTKKIEDLSGHGNHGLSYAVKHDAEGVTTSTDENNLGFVDAGLRGYNFGNDFAMILKFKFNKILEGNNALFNNLETGGIGLLLNNYNNKITIINGAYINNYCNFTKPYDFKENEWYTIVLTYDGTLANQNLKIYINGVLHDTIDVTGNVKTATHSVPLLIGAEPTYTFNTMGTTNYNSYATYKEALVFDRALTEEKDHISTNYKDDINVTNQDELLLWYKF